jgi:hypothetical protein
MGRVRPHRDKKFKSNFILRITDVNNVSKQCVDVWRSVIAFKIIWHYYPYFILGITGCSRLRNIFLPALVLIHVLRSSYAWKSVNAAWASMCAILLEYDNLKTSSNRHGVHAIKTLCSRIYKCMYVCMCVYIQTPSFIKT